MIKIKNLHTLDIFKTTAHNIVKLSSGSVSDIYHFYSDMEPAENGLFAEDIFGSIVQQNDSNKFAHIQLELPVVVAGTDGRGFCRNTDDVGCQLLQMTPAEILSLINFDTAIIVESDGLFEKNQIVPFDFCKQYDGNYLVYDSGPSAVKRLLLKTDLAEMAKSGTKRQKQIANELLFQNIKPEWFVADALPVLPPSTRQVVVFEDGQGEIGVINSIYTDIIRQNNKIKELANESLAHQDLQREHYILQQKSSELFDNWPFTECR